jgi:hypothetical protein
MGQARGIFEWPNLILKDHKFVGHRCRSLVAYRRFVRVLFLFRQFRGFLLGAGFVEFQRKVLADKKNTRCELTHRVCFPWPNAIPPPDQSNSNNDHACYI